jgi:chromosome segregation ATPase
VKLTDELQRLKAEMSAQAEEMAQIKANLRKRERRIEALDAELRTVSDEMREVAAQRAALAEELTSLRDRYRARLEAIIGSTASAPDSRPGQQGMGEVRQRQAIAQLIDASKDREAAASAESDALRRRLHAALRVQRDQREAYRQLHEAAEDAGVKLGLPTQEVELPEIERADASDAQAAERIGALEEKLRSSREDAATQQERYVLAVAEFASKVAKADAEAEKRAQEAQILREEIGVLKSSTGLQKLESLHKLIEEKLGAHQQQLAASSSLSAAAAPAPASSVADRDLIETLRSSARAAERERDEAVATAARLAQQLKRRQSAGGGGASNEALKDQLKESEKRAAGLLSRCTMLEAELASYKKYMTQTIAKYRGQQQRGAGSSGGDPNTIDNPENSSSMHQQF